MWSVDVPDASSDRFKTLWFDDDLNGKIRKSEGVNDCETTLVCI